MKKIREAIRGNFRAAGLDEKLADSDEFKMLVIAVECVNAQLPAYKADADMHRLWVEFEELRRTMLKVIRDFGPKKPWWKVW